MLLLANLFWGLSFPVIKSVQQTHLLLLPASNGWFVTAMTLMPRFLLGALVLVIFLRQWPGNFTHGEWKQGLLIGAFSTLGLLFQIDGMMHTSASTSAFLTQFYAIMIPLYVAFRTRRAPSPVIWAAVALVLAGVAVLGRFDFRELRLGRGEWETLVASTFFMGQILTLEDRSYAGNRVLPVTVVMFATSAVVFAGQALVTAPQIADVLVPWTSGPWLGLTALLTVFCTLGAFTIMNKYQPRITATEAGLIYCFEPIFGSLLALFLPAIFSAWAGIDYANETLTRHLLIGGGLITLANVLIQLKPPAKES